MASLPSDAIFDILKRVPIKSIQRFKSLNKFCYSSIMDPLFIHSHFSNSANERCMILSYMEHSNLNSIIHFLIFNIDGTAVLDYSATVSFDSYQILPSCNGLVCFYGLHGGVYVCNPSTKNIVRLPDNDDEGFRSLSCGFGFDQRNGEYKIIKFLQADNLRIEMFSMGSNSWKTITNDQCFGFQHHQPPVFAGGYFYWITADSINHPDRPSSFSIVSFDIANETFEVVSPPEGVSDKKWYHLYLVELGGDLCLVDLDYEIDGDKKKMEIWVKKLEQNWKQETIVHPSEPIETTRPVAFNGSEILLHGFIKGLGQLNWYDLQTGCFRRQKIQGVSSQCVHASHYVETLFPVNR